MVRNCGPYIGQFKLPVHILPSQALARIGSGLGLSSELTNMTASTSSGKWYSAVKKAPARELGLSPSSQNQAPLFSQPGLEMSHPNRSSYIMSVVAGLSTLCSRSPCRKRHKSLIEAYQPAAPPLLVISQSNGKPRRVLPALP